MELDWARSLRDECAEHGVPFFLKQLGGYPDARAHEKAVLDGVTHTEMPR
jgi:protein gp37